MVPFLVAQSHPDGRVAAEMGPQQQAASLRQILVASSGLGLMDSASPVCGMDVVIGAKWKTRILCALDRCPHRFGELRRAVGEVSEKVLTQQLRDLLARGIALAPLGRWAQQRDARAAG
ncbi:winged helix-turn-helix transcriptional regulator [Pseudonocardia lacus]|uniref:winged helix-turn-helix transcriptional regulator n=1 Tax=Pseudonocardia lacus TaxID=2835865 RepID=UPI00202870D9|nr:helix-turn-helix domain-containing protein [Pseudonocardia lacus]